MTIQERLRKLSWANLPTCPGGCEAAIAVRDQVDTFTYKDRAHDTRWEWRDFPVTVTVPVFWCEMCGEGWTDYRAEDIRAAAMLAHQLARKIDYDVLQKIKIQNSVDK